ncbi:MAG: protein kinase [bacterium]|nr:protein kinase [bacterium]
MSVETGRELSHYRLIEKLGEGGEGVVWRARDRRLDREVAIKMLPDGIENDPKRMARLTREARTVAGLNHPNIVTIHSVEEVDGQRLVVMEFVRGEPLRQVIPRGGLPVERFFRLAEQAADAVHAAHVAGVTHRDLKPGNIVVGPTDRLKVLDFGFARSPEPPIVGDISERSTSSIPDRGRAGGTVSYMSPEQVNDEDVDHRSDLFSLGVILYEMATGRHPFPGKTVAEVIAATLRDEPPSAPDVRGELPRKLGTVLARAMAKPVDRRYSSARDLHADLERIRIALERGTAVLGADTREDVVEAIAVLPLEDLSWSQEQDFFADGLTEELITTLARVRALKVISRTSVMQYRDVRKPLPVMAAELGVDAVVEGSVLRSDERVRIDVRLIDARCDRPLWSETYEEPAGDILVLQGRVARSIAESIQVKLTPLEHAHLSRNVSVDPAVHEACLKGRHFWHKRTHESVRRGLQYFEEAARLDPTYAPPHAGIADSYIVDGGRYLGVSPGVAYGKARDAAERAIELDESLAEAHTSIAAVMTDYDWDWEGADREYRRAIELNPGYVTAHSWFAEQLSRMGRHDEAVAEARYARDLDPLSRVSNMILAWILFFARRYEESIRQAHRALELNPDYATAHRILGWAYEETGRHEEAIAAHTRAAELTAQEPNFAGQLGRAYAVAGRSDRAHDVLESLLVHAKTRYVSELDIAIVYAALGESESALDWLERAFDERADHLPYLKVNPRLDVLRSAPRFKTLLQRMGLE